MKWAVFAYFYELLYIVRSLADGFERQTLSGCQCYQKTNPDGVICGGIGWRWDVRVNVNVIGIINSASVDHLMS